MPLTTRMIRLPLALEAESALITMRRREANKSTPQENTTVELTFMTPSGGHPRHEGNRPTLHPTRSAYRFATATAWPRSFDSEQERAGHCGTCRRAFLICLPMSLHSLHISVRPAEKPKQMPEQNGNAWVPTSTRLCRTTQLKQPIEFKAAG